MTKDILLVEDDVSFRDTLGTWLQEQGYNVEFAKNGSDGLKKFQHKRPSLLLTDIVMPETDGIELLFAIHKQHKGFPCKVIAMSGGGRIKGDEYLDMISVLGIDVLLTKPFKLSELKSHLQQLLP